MKRRWKESKIENKLQVNIFDDRFLQQMELDGSVMVDSKKSNIQEHTGETEEKAAEFVEKNDDVIQLSIAQQPETDGKNTFYRIVIIKEDEAAELKILLDPMMPTRRRALNDFLWYQMTGRKSDRILSEQLLMVETFTDRPKIPVIDPADLDMDGLPPEVDVYGIPEIQAVVAAEAVME